MAESKNKKNTVVGAIVFVVLLAMVVIGLYLKLSKNKDDGKLEADVAVSEVNSILSRNMESDYPATAREVLKYYARITKCLYGEELSEKEIEQLTDRIRMLYCKKLLNDNPREDMLLTAKSEIAHYRSNNMAVTSYNISESADIKYLRDVTPNRAIINMYFLVKHDKQFDRSYEEFVLEEESTGVWKIVGWRANENQ